VNATLPSTVPALQAQLIETRDLLSKSLAEQARLEARIWLLTKGMHQ